MWLEANTINKLLRNPGAIAVRLRIARLRAFGASIVGVIILKGVQIGANAVVGAGAVVTHLIGEGAVVAGVLAQSNPNRAR